LARLTTKTALFSAQKQGRCRQKLAAPAGGILAAGEDANGAKVFRLCNRVEKTRD